MPSVERIEPFLAPVRKTVTVAKPPAEAFEIFTARLAEWWPLARFSIHQAEATTCVLEPREGGKVYELARDGRRGEWGTVIRWDPPHALVLRWHPGNPEDEATEVEVRFLAQGPGTRVELTHRNWTRLGARAAESRAGYEGGWAHVFGVCFVEACA